MSKRKYGADTKTSAAFTITKVSLLTPSAFPTAAMFGVPPVYTPTSIPATLALSATRSAKIRSATVVATHTATKTHKKASKVCGACFSQPRKSKEKSNRGMARATAAVLRSSASCESTATFGALPSARPMM